MDMVTVGFIGYLIAGFTGIEVFEAPLREYRKNRDNVCSSSGLLLQNYYICFAQSAARMTDIKINVRGELAVMGHSLQIGKHVVQYPVIQGGMGVRVSAGRLAGHVAKSGGVGLVAAPGIALNSPFFNGRNFFQADAEAFKDELRKAYEIAPNGIIGVNVMVALSDFESLVKAAIEGGAKVIVCGAGLPIGLPELTADHPDVALVPIVSSLRAAQLIARKWQKAYHRLPDAVVVEDPDTAGGHLGEKMEKIGTGEYDQYETVREIKAFFGAAPSADG